MAAKLETIAVSRLRHEELFGLAQKLIEHFPLLSAATEVKQTLTNYQAATDAFDAVLKPLRKSTDTDDIAAADATRDRVLTGMGYFLKSLEYDTTYSKAEQETVQKLQFIFNNYGSVQKLSYIEESGTIANLLADLQAVPGYDQLGLDRWTNQLISAEKAFNDLFKQRTDTMAGVRLPVGSTKQAFNALADVHRELTTLVNALVVVKPTVYEPFILRANEIIQRLKAEMKARATRAKKDPEEAEA